MKKMLSIFVIVGLLLGVGQVMFVTHKGDLASSYNHNALCQANLPSCGVCDKYTAGIEGEGKVINYKCYENYRKLYGYPIRTKSQTSPYLLLNTLLFVSTALVIYLAAQQATTQVKAKKKARAKTASKPKKSKK